MGQGHETIFAQICADGLGVPLESITVYHGSTDLTPYGGGTYASRGTTLAGNAVYGAAQKLREIECWRWRRRTWTLTLRSWNWPVGGCSEWTELRRI